MNSATGASCILAYGVVILDINRLGKSLLFSLSWAILRNVATDAESD